MSFFSKQKRRVIAFQIERPTYCFKVDTEITNLNDDTKVLFYHDSLPN